MLVAWDAGVGSCPNGVSDPDAMREILGLSEDDRFAIVLSFGHPARPVDPGARSPEDWLQRADRRPLEDILERR
jgi:nitroreductase